MRAVLLAWSVAAIGCVTGGIDDPAASAEDSGVPDERSDHDAALDVDPNPVEDSGRAASDVAVDAAPDVAKDAAPDVAKDAAPDVAVDAAPDVAVDAGSDTGGVVKLPLPDERALVKAIGDAHPDLVARSCQTSGGTWELMDLIVDTLRKKDTRWGYNWKRGKVGDPSLDVVDYHWGTGPSEGSIDVYIIDVVAGHCGPDPKTAWTDVTASTAAGGTIGMWTGRGRF